MGLLTKFKTARQKRETVNGDSAVGKDVKETPVVIISGRPRSATAPQPFFQATPSYGRHDYHSTSTSRRGKERSRAGLQDVSNAPKAGQSLSFPSEPQRQPQPSELFDDRGQAEEIIDSPLDEREALVTRWGFEPESTASDVSHSPPSAFKASHLKRRASGKVLDLGILKVTSRGKTWFYEGRDSGGEETPSGLPGNDSTISLGSIQSSVSHQSPTKKSPYSRVKTLSTSSTRDLLNILPSSSNFSRPFSRSQQTDSTPDLPCTSPAAATIPLPSGLVEPALASPSRRKRATGKSPRPSTASGPPPNFDYLASLSLPPRGLPVNDLEGRIATVGVVVQARALEESRARGKTRLAQLSSLKMPVRPSSPFVSSGLLESVVERLEEELHGLMQEDIRQGTDAQHYQALHLTDVFIEARRSLGLDSDSMRLHSMFDVTESKQLLCGLVDELRPPPSSKPDLPGAPPSAWIAPRTNNHVPSLSPAPRKRRPKTAPTDRTDTTGRFQPADRTENSPSFGRSFSPAMPKLSGPSPLNEGSADRRNSGLIASPPHTSDSMDEAAREVQSQVLTPALLSSRSNPAFSPKKAAPSLPPSPPQSSESHRSDSMKQASAAPAHLSGLHSIPTQPRWSVESQTLTKGSCYEVTKG